jgi:hypothetical protein
MTYKVTVKFFMDNGEVRRVDWLERHLVKKDSNEYLTREEAETQFRAMLVTFLKEGKVFSVPNIMGKVSIVPCSKVSYMELSVQEYKEGDKDGGN